jgi:hypothetical protein
MALTIRRLLGPKVFREVITQLLSLYYRLLFSHFGNPAIGNGTTAGRLRTTASATGRVAGMEVTKASTDDLWNLSGETATGAAVYRAYWLYLSAAGAASIAAGSDAASGPAALAALPSIDVAKSVWGVYVAGPSTNFANALAAQRTIYNGIPDGAALPGGVVLYSAPQIITVTAA